MAGERIGAGGARRATARGWRAAVVGLALLGGGCGVTGGGRAIDFAVPVGEGTSGTACVSRFSDDRLHGEAAVVGRRYLFGVYPYGDIEARPAVGAGVQRWVGGMLTERGYAVTLRERCAGGGFDVVAEGEVRELWVSVLQGSGTTFARVHVDLRVRRGTTGAEIWSGALQASKAVEGEFGDVAAPTLREALQEAARWVPARFDGDRGVP
jgi:hypothetical protein